jgi:PPOX class probable F420-dependent enzyme
MIKIGPETEDFLGRMPNLILGTLRRDGSPQASPLWYRWANGEFTISTVTHTAKWWNLQRDPRCSVCVDEPETGRMVVAYGSAELREEDVWNQTAPLVAKYYPGRPAEARAHMDRIFGDEARRVIIAVRPSQVIVRRLDEEGDLVR